MSPVLVGLMSLMCTVLAVSGGALWRLGTRVGSYETLTALNSKISDLDKRVNMLEHDHERNHPLPSAVRNDEETQR